MSLIPTLSERLSQIIEPLRRAVAAYGGKHRAAVPVVVLLWGYLHRVAKRFAALAERSGKARPAAPSKPRERRPATTPRPRLPQGVGWLGQFGSEFRCYGSQLRHLLATKEMRDLLEASPQAVKILSPLCRMLGIEPGPDLPAGLCPFPPRTRPPVPTTRPDPPLAAEPDAPAVLPRPWMFCTLV